jgi:hypothetical protein
MLENAMAIDPKKALDFIKVNRKGDHTLDAMSYVHQIVAKGNVINDIAVKDNIFQTDRTRPWSPYEKLAMRLNVPRGEEMPCDNCHIVSSPNKTFVFVVKGDKALILEDDPFLFPSDRLVGQFLLFVRT